ncbi:hypothetical protein AMJ83_06940 [candidate division WOR_3 bacterium SM23_42]|uniref:Protein BatD n=1 Tax=candidate division WOR_3 bacterium SM23_42 TaxID=1703779 RepID=A0A0S8FRQ4_UNCW3|nr:MAG: hypothetical protein AMJ83_06940 [candidate division WOR_3 bacterium SM23_42]
MILLLLITQIEIKAQISGAYVNKELTIGDPFELTLFVQYPQGTEISEPFVDSVEPFMILQQEGRVIEEEGMVTKTYDIRLVPFGTGALSIPRFKFLYRTGETLDTLSSNMVTLNVASVKPQDMQDINDIKKAVEFPNLLPLIIAGIVLIGAVVGYLAYRYVRRIQKMRKIAKPLPPPWIEAIVALENIPLDDWLTKGLIKKLYYALSEILKKYLERRFVFKAAEQTTTEIIAHLKERRIPQRDEFNDFFTRADMVKYAKYMPPQDEISTVVDTAKELVDKTRPEETTAEKA